MRRPHRKSRNGCKQCKQRHLRCDEHRPTCINCSCSERQCSYLDQAVSVHTAAVLGYTSSSATSTPVAWTASSPSSLEAVVGTAPARTHGAGSQPDEAVPQIFDLGHLVLLHHLETDMLRTGVLHQHQLVADEKDGEAFLEMIFTSAVAAPYLMDELLAFSALHLATLKSDTAEKQHYHHQAAQLQTRAIMLFNEARVEVREETCVAMFIFSSMLGMHLLFDAVRDHCRFGETLDKFIQYLNVHKGVRSITKNAWHVICQSHVRVILDAIDKVEQAPPKFTAASTQCDKLINLLTTSADSLGPRSLEACCEAVQSLQWAHTQHGALPKAYKTHIVLSWPLSITAEYINLLKQRRPEALAVLAHWAILLHYERDFWLFGDAGRFFIESIADYLGTYWREWMSWPTEVLETT